MGTKPEPSETVLSKTNGKTTEKDQTSSTEPNGKAVVAQVAKADKSTIEIVAEREIIIKMIEIIDVAIKRKALLLESIEAMNVVGAKQAKKGEKIVDPAFLEHYGWLLANLTATTKCLESALVHLQVMYGGKVGGE